MKKIVLLMLVALGVMTSCQKEELFIGDGSEVDVTFVASLTSSTSKSTDNVGTGGSIDRCILEVYYTNTSGEKVLYKRMENSESVGFTSTSFSLRLISGMNYDFVAWADKSGVYTADDLRAISLSGDYAGNDEGKDAFFGVENKTITTAMTVPMTLKRPFGQLNVFTSLTDVIADLTPASVKVTYVKVPSTFNALTTEVGTTTLTSPYFEAAIVATDDANTLHLSTDYIFALEGEQSTVDFVMDFYSDDACINLITTNSKFVNIPLQRNYRTNVSGELLTVDAEVKTTIDPIFTEPAFDVEITDETTIAELDDALDTYSTQTNAAFIITDQVASTTTITIPAYDGTTTSGETTTRSFDFTEGIAANATLTIEDAESSQGIDIVYITVSESTNTSSLIINLPNSTVYVNGEIYSLITTTDIATLIITEGSVVDGLTVKKGNVKVYGTLTGDVTSEVAITVTVYAATANITGATFGNNITLLYVDETMAIQNTTSGYSYTVLSEAISAASEGDVLTLAAGTYDDTITIDKSLTLKGAQAGVDGRSREYTATATESVLTGIITVGGSSGVSITFDGLYFDGSTNTAEGKIYFNALTYFYITNCLAYDIYQQFLYSNNSSTLKEEVVVYQNKFSGNQTDDASIIYIANAQSMKVTNNYFEGATRGVNLTVKSDSKSTFEPNNTQATIQNNTITNMSNYAVQTSYYPYGKIVIKNNIISNIAGGADGVEDGAINIRGYKTGTGVTSLDYTYEITGNTFTNVSSLFLTRLYNETDATALTLDDEIKITGNTISVDADTKLLVKNDKYAFNGTLDLSENTITGVSSYEDYLSLKIGAAVKMPDGVTYSCAVYNETQGIGYVYSDTVFNSVISDAVSGDEITLTAGTFSYTGLGLGKSLTINGPNAGIAGYSENRVAEAVITSQFYQAPTNSAIKLSFVVDGVTLAGASGFCLQGGGDVTLKNSIVSSSDTMMGSTTVNDRVYYTHGSYLPSTIVLEDNLFQPSDNELNEVWIYGNTTDNSYDAYVDVTIQNNVFDNTCVNLGTGYYTGEGEGSKFDVNNNIFRNISGNYTYFGNGSLEAYALLFKTGSASCPNATFSVVDNSFESTVANKFTYITSSWTYASEPTYSVVTSTFTNNGLDGYDSVE